MKEVPLFRRSTLPWVILVGLGAILGILSFYLPHRALLRGNRKVVTWVPGTTLLVEARGVGRAWLFTYSGADGIVGTTDDVASSDLLMLPVGADVVIELRSSDYIYVFSCPSLKLNEIAVPELEYSLEFRVDDLGDYNLVMDPMCGFQLPPGETMGTLSVASQTEFSNWIRERIRSE